MTDRNHEPPLFHAQASWDEPGHALIYRYNGRDIVTVRMPAGCKPVWRGISDGDLCSTPMCQHMTVTAPAEAEARVEFRLSSGAVNMRPRRAESGEAILAQNGRPLIVGVNGMYDADDDLLISWHGRPWRWLGDCAEESGGVRCAMAVELGRTPLVLLFRMQYYRMHLGFRYHAPWEWRPDGKAVTGWCSWEAYRSDVSAPDVAKSARFLAKRFRDYGLEYMQIDDGYQQKPQPADPDGHYYDIFLKTNGKFPGGHRDIISPVKAAGLRPGIWTNVSVTNGEFAKRAPFIVKDAQGDPVQIAWLGYLMDCTPETLQGEVLPMYRGLREAGYDYFKTDSIRHLYLDGLRSLAADGRLTNDEARRRFRALLQCARRGVGGDAYLLSCWGMLTEAVGIADACRIATDAGPSWPQLRMQLYETARWYHTHRVLFTNDPDHVCVRAELEHARSALSLTALSGGLFMVSDTVDAYDRRRVDMIRRTMPALETMTAETGQVDLSAHAWGAVLDWEKAATGEENPFGSLWCVHFARGGRRWAVAGRFAIEALRGARVALDKLGLDPAVRYAAYDFWGGRYLGVAEHAVRFRALAMGRCQVIALHPLGGRPFVLASDRHISMDAVSVLEESFSGGVLRLRLAGIRGRAFGYGIWAPEGLAPKCARAEGAKVSLRARGGLTGLRVAFTEKQAEVLVEFSGKGE